MLKQIAEKLLGWAAEGVVQSTREIDADNLASYLKQERDSAISDLHQFGSKIDWYLTELGYENGVHYKINRKVFAVWGEAYDEVMQWEPDTWICCQILRGKIDGISNFKPSNSSAEYKQEYRFWHQKRIILRQLREGS